MYIFFVVTKDEEKLQNINDALKIFDEWLKDFDKKNLSKENRSYLQLPIINVLLPLKNKYEVDDKKCVSFLEAYKSVKGDYKNLRTVISGDNEPTWDIIRNVELKKLIEEIDEKSLELWNDDDLPTKIHLQLILWAYSPEANRLKKNLAKIEEKLGKNSDVEMKSDEEDKKKTATKRKSSESDDSSNDDESPSKKSKRD